MIKFSLSLFTFSVILFSCKAQLTFQKNYHNQGTIYCIKKTSDSGYVAIGTIYPDVNFFILKTDESGDTIWTRTFINNSGMGLSCNETVDGGFIFTGVSSGVILIRTNPYGDTLWTKEFDSPGYDGGWSAIQTTDGGFIISGYTNGSGNDEDICLIKTDFAGDTLWTKAFRASAFHAYGCSVFETADQGFVLAGTLSDKIILIRTNSSGDTLWTKAFGQPNAACLDMKPTSDGGCILVGSGFGGVLVIKTDTVGSLQWSKIYNAPAAEGRSIDKYYDGGYFITGHKNDSTGTPLGFSIRTDSIGDTLWTRKYLSTDTYSCITALDNGFVVAGTSTLQPYLSEIIKMDSIGNTSCNDVVDQFIINTPGNLISSINLTLSTTQFSIFNSGFQMTSGNTYEVLCSSVGIPHISDASVFIYPNPVSEILSIAGMTNENLAVNIYNFFGVKVLTSYHTNRINIRSIPSGIYVGVIHDGERTISKRFIKE